MSPAAAIGLVDTADLSPGMVGGKAHALGLMARMGLPVPEGFVIPAGAADAGAILAAELERRGWTATPLAVRSSAPHEDGAKASFAGIYASRLNVVGPDAARRAADEVLASLWMPRALAYRQRMGVPDEQAAMAVLVTPMVPAVAAGVAFTCEPRSGRDNLMLISAVRGLGEALVDGSETGEEIVVAEARLDDGLSLVSRTPARQSAECVPAGDGGTFRRPLSATTGPILDDSRALELAHLLRDAARALNYADPAFDVEWVWTGERFVLVQARPITARGWHTYPGLAGQAPIWSNGNTRDVAPLVMGPMDWVGSRLLADLILEQAYRRTGFAVLDGARRSALFGGRLYLNASLIQWEAWDALGLPPRDINAFMGGHHPEIPVSPPGRGEKLARLGRVARYALGSAGWRRRGLAEAEATFAETRMIRALDLTALGDRDLSEHLLRLGRTTRSREALLFLQGAGGGSLFQVIETIRKRLPAEAPALAAAIMSGGEPSVSTRQGHDTLELADLARREPAIAARLRRGPPWNLADLPPGSAFRAALDGFIERYGHRGIYETYFRNPRLREDPSFLLESVAGLLDVDPAALTARQTTVRAAAWKRLDAALPLAARLMLRVLIGPARMEGRQRELARSALAASGEAVRLLLLEMGRRLCRRGILDDRGDIFDLTPHEALDAMDGKTAGLRSRIRHRRRQMAHWDANPAPDTVIGDGLAAPPRPAALAAGEGWSGVSVGGGVVEGVARIVPSPEQGGGLRPGDILVAPSTDPAWTPLFLRAGGLVMETGGYVSHGAIIARELGIPAVINLPGILDAIRDGQRVRVDGDRGVVRVV